MRSGVVSNSYVEFFCLTLSKTAVGELFSLSIILRIEKVRMRDWGGGSVKIFRRKFLVSQCRKIRRVPSMLCFRKIPVAKVYG